jgi:hypothetical protein
VPRLKGYPYSFHLPDSFEVFPHERRTVFDGFPSAGRQAIFNHGNLEIPLGNGQNFVLENARKAYHGFHRLARWQDRDALYFFGYALSGYLSFPFVFPVFELVSVSTYKTRNETWDVLTVDFPEDFDSHCRRQSFYFDASGLLRRNDYHAQIISRIAMGAHYSFEYNLVNGIEVALQRRVFVRFGRSATPVNALSADLKILDEP